MCIRDRWNVPTAAKHCNLTRKEMMITFNEYCALHEPTYTKFNNAIQLNIDYEQEITKDSS